MAVKFLTDQDMVTVIDENVTDEQYPTAKAVYDFGQNGGSSVDNEEISKITAKMELTSTNPANIYDASKTTPGYVSTYGDIFDSSTLVYTEKIPVSEGDIIRCYSIDKGVTLEARKMEFLTAYNADGIAVSDAGVKRVNMHTIPSGITHIVITVSKAYTIMVTKNREATEYVPYEETEYYYKATPEFVGVANQNSFGLVKVWSEEIDGEKVLHISTEV